MSDAMVSVLDALDDPRALQGIRDEVLEMDLAVKRHMDRGLTPDEWAGKDLQAKMTEMLGKDEVSPEDMMALQFEVGQYNAMLESLSSVTKSMTDMMKSLAQRTG